MTVADDEPLVLATSLRLEATEVQDIAEASGEERIAMLWRKYEDKNGRILKAFIFHDTPKLHISGLR